MKLVIGLGNPGQKYSRTRHNIGFAVLDCFAGRNSIKWKDHKGIALAGKSDSFVLVKPTDFMNNSGRGAAPFVAKCRPLPGEMLVIHDDMDIAFGCMKIKPSGSSGGHNGVQSLIDVLGTQEFARLRIGIGRPPEGVDPVEYVLSGFAREELPLFKNIVERAADAIECFVAEGIVKATNAFNRKAKEDKTNDPKNQA